MPNFLAFTTEALNRIVGSHPEHIAEVRAIISARGALLQALLQNSPHTRIHTVNPVG